MLSMVAALALTQVSERGPLWFGFFVRGKAIRKYEAKELEEMQAGHIANLRRRFGEKKLIAAGPLGDPTQVRRGIIVLTVPNHLAIAECFKTDPFVQSGLLKLQPFRWDADRSGINDKNPDPDHIEENRIAILTAKGTLTEKEIAGHRKWMATSFPNVVGGTSEDGVYREFILWQGPEEATLKRAVEADPLVKSGKAAIELMPVWLAKGSLYARRSGSKSARHA